MNYYEKAREFCHDYEHYSYESLKDVRDQLLKDIARYEKGNRCFIPIDEDLETDREQYLADLLYAGTVFSMMFKTYQFKERNIQ